MLTREWNSGRANQVVVTVQHVNHKHDGYVVFGAFVPLPVALEFLDFRLVLSESDIRYALSRRSSAVANPTATELVSGDDGSRYGDESGSRPEDGGKCTLT